MAKFARVESGVVRETLVAASLPEFHPDIAAQWLSVADHVVEGYISDGLGGLIAPTVVEDVPAARAQRKGVMEAARRADMAAGLNSPALGEAHFYAGGPEYESYLAAAAVTAISAGTVDFPCRKISDGTRAYRAHTSAQINQVLSDLTGYRKTLLQRLDTRYASIDAAATVAAVEAISWA